jgi:hypothetical protein
VQRLYVYTGSLVVLGLSLGVPAAHELRSGTASLPLVLTAVGGAGLVVTAGYEAVRTDPDEFTASTVALGVLVAAAGLAVLGTLLSATSGG